MSWEWPGARGTLQSVWNVSGFFFTKWNPWKRSLPWTMQSDCLKASVTAEVSRRGQFWHCSGRCFSWAWRTAGCTCAASAKPAAPSQGKFWLWVWSGVADCLWSAYTNQQLHYPHVCLGIGIAPNSPSRRKTLHSFFSPIVSTKTKGKSHLCFSRGGWASSWGCSICLQVDGSLILLASRFSRWLCGAAAWFSRRTIPSKSQRKLHLAPSAFARLRSVLFLVNLHFWADRFWIARSVFCNFSYLK